jgi:hypothetical protein
MLIIINMIIIGKEEKKRLSSLDWTALKRSLDDQNMNLDTKNTDLDTTITSITKNKDYFSSKNDKNVFKNDASNGSIDSKVERSISDTSSKKSYKGKKDSPLTVPPPSMFRGRGTPLMSGQSKKGAPPLNFRPTKSPVTPVGGGGVPKTIKGEYINYMHASLYTDERMCFHDQ